MSAWDGSGPVDQGRFGLDRPRGGRVGAGAVTAAVLVVLVVLVGLTWAKWLPYGQRVGDLWSTRTWDTPSLFPDRAASPSLTAGWDFLLAYAAAVWRALLVALIVAAAVQALLPRERVARLLNRRGSWGQALAGGMASTATMMCTCCAAPLVSGLQRTGVRRSALAAFWLGNPLLNPAVLAFLLLVGPWPWGATRLVVGLLLTIGVAVLVGRSTGAPETSAPQAVSAAPRTGPVGTVRAFLVSLARMSLVLVPEYAVVVLLVGAFRGSMPQLADVSSSYAGAGLLLVAVVATLLVVPTGGEIPVLLGLAALGASPVLLGVLLVALPALSLPSLVMVARALTVRAAATAAGCVVLGSLAAGGLLALLD